MPGSPVVRCIHTLGALPARESRLGLLGRAQGGPRTPGGSPPSSPPSSPLSSPPSPASPPSPSSPASGLSLPAPSAPGPGRRCRVFDNPPAARRSLASALEAVRVPVSAPVAPPSLRESAARLPPGTPAHSASTWAPARRPDEALRRQVQRLAQALAALGQQVGDRPMRVGLMCSLFTRLADAHGPALAEAIEAMERSKPWPVPQQEAWREEFRQARLWLQGLQDLRDLLHQLDPAARLGAPARLREDLQERYARESREMVQDLLASGDPRQQKEALTYARLVVPGEREHFCGPLPLAYPAADGHGGPAPAGLGAGPLLLMRLMAHPDSGAFNAMRALFLLAQAHPGLGLHRTLGGIGEQYCDTVHRLAALPGTRVAGELFKGVVLRGGGPWARPAAAGGGAPFRVLWPMSATTHPAQAYLAVNFRERHEYDGLLRLRGGVQAIHAHWFHPSRTVAQCEALVLPGQWLRVIARAAVPGPDAMRPGYLLMVLEPAPVEEAGPLQAASL